MSSALRASNGLSAKQSVKRNRAAPLQDASAHRVIAASAIFEAKLDSHPETSLDLQRVKSVLAERGYRKPVLVLDSELVRVKARRFMATLPRVRPHYAVK